MKTCVEKKSEWNRDNCMRGPAKIQSEEEFSAKRKRVKLRCLSADVIK
jgi:hypothetical protein